MQARQGYQAESSSSSYGLVVHLLLLPTPPLGDAVAFGFRPESVYLERTCTSLIVRALRRTCPRLVRGSLTLAATNRARSCFGCPRLVRGSLTLAATNRARSCFGCPRLVRGRFTFAATHRARSCFGCPRLGRGDPHFSSHSQSLKM